MMKVGWSYRLLVTFLVLGVVGLFWVWRDAESGNGTAVETSQTVTPYRAGTLYGDVAMPGATSDLPTSTPIPVAHDTALPSATFTATHTITPLPSWTPTVTSYPSLTPTITLTATPIVGAPTPVPERTSAYDLVNILVLGNDGYSTSAAYRSDVVIIVSVNRTTSSVNMLSIPRDLYVYIPAHGYSRINTATVWGATNNWPGGSIGLLKEAIRYNFGIPIHHYARVDFSGFSAIIDTVGGIDLVVDCALTDYRLRAPGLSPNLRDNWEWVTLNAGLNHMDGATALWYARSRATTSDFDRNRRHQMVLRAIWGRFQADNMWDQVPVLWEALSNAIETDLTLNDILSLVPIGIGLTPSLIQSHYIGPSQVEDFTTDQGGAVLAMKPDAVQVVVDQFMLPPPTNVLQRENPRVEVHNQSGAGQMEWIASERLARVGLTAVIEAESTNEPLPRTIIYDYTGEAKGSSLTLIQEQLGVLEADIIHEPDPDRTVDYRIILGQSFDSCTYR